MTISNAPDVKEEKQVFVSTCAYALQFFAEPPFQVLLSTSPSIGILSKDEEKGEWHMLVDARPHIPEPYSFKVKAIRDGTGAFLVTRRGFWLEGINHTEGEEGKEATREVGQQ